MGIVRMGNRRAFARHPHLRSCINTDTTSSSRGFPVHVATSTSRRNLHACNNRQYPRVPPRHSLIANSALFRRFALCRHSNEFIRICTQKQSLSNFVVQIVVQVGVACAPTRSGYM